MSNNHEFYLDHKKKQAADGQTDGQVNIQEEGGRVCQG